VVTEGVAGELCGPADPPICEGVYVDNGNGRPTPPTAVSFKYTNTFGDPEYDEVCITVNHNKTGTANLADPDMVSDGGTFVVSKNGAGGNKKLNPELEVKTVLMPERLPVIRTSVTNSSFTPRVHSHCLSGLFSETVAMGSHPLRDVTTSRVPTVNSSFWGRFRYPPRPARPR
jgi:hypothetical protein